MTLISFAVTECHILHRLAIYLDAFEDVQNIYVTKIWSPIRGQLVLAHKLLLNLKIWLTTYPDHWLENGWLRPCFCSHNLHPHRLPLREGKANVDRFFFQSIACASSASSSKCSLRFFLGLSSVQRSSQWHIVARFLHCSPSGISHERELVISTNEMVLKTFRKNACGMPHERFADSCGRKLRTIFHCSYVISLNFPAVMKACFEYSFQHRKLYLVSEIGS